MTLEPNDFALEISKALTATGEDYTMTAVDLNMYGTSYEITKRKSKRKIYLTPADDHLIDMVLFDEKGATIANGTMFVKAAKDITPEELTTIVGICL